MQDLKDVGDRVKAKKLVPVDTITWWAVQVADDLYMLYLDDGTVDPTYWAAADLTLSV